MAPWDRPSVASSVTRAVSAHLQYRLSTTGGSAQPVNHPEGMVDRCNRFRTAASRRSEPRSMTSAGGWPLRGRDQRLRQGDRTGSEHRHLRDQPTACEMASEELRQGSTRNGAARKALNEPSRIRPGVPCGCWREPGGHCTVSTGLRRRTRASPFAPIDTPELRSPFRPDSGPARALDSSTLSLFLENRNGPVKAVTVAHQHDRVAGPVVKIRFAAVEGLTIPDHGDLHGSRTSPQP